MKARKAKEFVFNDLLSMESYCIDHYSDYYSKSNFSCNVTQLSKGELVTSSICAPINDAHLEIFKSNQNTLLSAIIYSVKILDPSEIELIRLVLQPYLKYDTQNIQKKQVQY